MDMAIRKSRKTDLSSEKVSQFTRDIQDQRIADLTPIKPPKKVTFMSQGSVSLHQDIPDFSHQFKTVSGHAVKENIESNRVNSIIIEENSSMQEIMLTVQPIFQYFKSELGFQPISIKEYAREPEVFTMKFASAEEKANCFSIASQLSYKTRLRARNFKEQGSQNPSNDSAALDLNHLSFQIYGEVIDEKINNQLFQSVIGAYGSLGLEDKLDPQTLPQKYEIRQKKALRTVQINTDNLEYFSKIAAFDSLGSIELIQLEIERQKGRKPRAADYQLIIESKLLQLLDLILQKDKKYHGITVNEKIKRVLSDIESFKGKKIEGHLKTNLLLYFFKEYNRLQETKNNKEIIIKDEAQRHKNRPSKDENASSIRSTSTKAIRLSKPSEDKKQRPRQLLKDSNRDVEKEWIGVRT